MMTTDETVARCFNRNKEIEPLHKFRLYFMHSLSVVSINYFWKIFQPQSNLKFSSKDFLTDILVSSSDIVKISDQHSQITFIHFLVFFSICFLDVETILPFSISAWCFRLWLLSVCILFYMVTLDWLYTPVFYKLNGRQTKPRISPFGTDEQIHSVLSSDVSLSQCTLSILQAKVLYVENQQQEDVGHQVQFQIIITHQLKR